jgi:hypothetical protein
MRLRWANRISICFLSKFELLPKWFGTLAAHLWQDVWKRLDLPVSVDGFPSSSMIFVFSPGALAIRPADR